jgi:RimJ/RimL family protein N-acetyltransferase
MKIELEILNESEFPEIVEWVNRHDADFVIQWAGLTYTFPLTVDQMKHHYKNGINSASSGVYIYKIIEKEADEVVGTFQLARFDHTKKEAVIGRFLIKDQRYRGLGIGELALRQLVRMGFEQFGLSRIRLNVFNINKSAIRCYEKVGFVRGNVTERVYKSTKGEPWDNIEMIIDKECAV